MKQERNDGGWKQENKRDPNGQVRASYMGFCVIMYPPFSREGLDRELWRSKVVSASGRGLVTDATTFETAKAHAMTAIKRNFY